MRTLSGYHGLYSIREHAAQRIHERFGVEHPAEQLLWVYDQMGQALHADCEMMRPYLTAPRIKWFCWGGVVIITDGNDVWTAYREGEQASDEDNTAA